MPVGGSISKSPARGMMMEVEQPPSAIAAVAGAAEAQKVAARPTETAETKRSDVATASDCSCWI